MVWIEFWPPIDNAMKYTFVNPKQNRFIWFMLTWLNSNLIDINNKCQTLTKRGLCLIRDETSRPLKPYYLFMLIICSTYQSMVGRVLTQCTVSASSGAGTGCCRRSAPGTSPHNTTHRHSQCSPPRWCRLSTSEFFK